MGDRTSVAIEIGGNLDAALLPELIEAIEADGLDFDWGMSEVTKDTLLSWITPDAEKPEGSSLYLTAHKVNYASLETLESFCAEHGLPYRKEWDAGGDYGAGGELFDGQKTVKYTTSQIGGSPALTAHEIRSFGGYEKLLAYLDTLQAPVPPLRLTEPSRRVTFIGQAWINNHALEVDDSRATFLVSEAEYQAAGGDDTDDYDALKDAARAPDWVKSWPGPFEIEVADDE